MIIELSGMNPDQLVRFRVLFWSGLLATARAVRCIRGIQLKIVDLFSGFVINIFFAKHYEITGSRLPTYLSSR